MTDRLLRLGLPLLCSLVALTGVALGNRHFDLPRQWVFDLYQWSGAPDRDPARLVIIDIEAESVHRIGQWPWPRDHLARLIDASAPARVVGVDILMFERDRLASGESDAALVAAIGRTPTVLAAAEEARETGGPARPVLGVPVFEAGTDTRAALPRVTALAFPLQVFAEVAQGVGIAAAVPGPDGVLRSLPSLFNVDATLRPSFALEVLRVAERSPTAQVTGVTGGVRHVAVGGRTIATDASGAIWPRFSSSVPARVVPAHRVLSGEVSPDQFTGRIVLIGSSLAGLGDRHMTPLGLPQSGTAINAQVIASVLEDDVLWRPSGAGAVELSAFALLTATSLLLFGRIRDRRYVMVLAGMAAAPAAVGFAVFARYGALLDWSLPTVGLAVTNIVALAVRAQLERRLRMGREAELAGAQREVEVARRMVARALESAKLATLGEMATVLAHELQQPIAVMSLAAENAVASLEDGAAGISYARARMARITDQAKRARSIIDHLRVFGRSDAGGQEAVDLADAVAGALILVGPVLRQGGVDVRIDCPPETPRVTGNKVLIEQVIVNLCINACHALSEQPQGQRAVWITARLTADDARTVELTVTDNGPGIPDAVLPHLFDPFFTTKPAGLGTGLGLSISRRIVESFGGGLRVGEASHVGAVFTATLRVAERAIG